MLLVRTAVPTSGFEPPTGREGAGSVNAYAMIRVAANLKAAYWPQTGRCSEPPPDPSIFDFGREASALKSQAFAKLKQFGCDQQKEAAALLRTAFFLNPRDPQIRSSLRELYRANGLSAQAAFGSLGASQTIQGIQETGVKLALGIREVAGSRDAVSRGRRPARCLHRSCSRRTSTRKARAARAPRARWIHRLRCTRRFWRPSLRIFRVGPGDPGFDRAPGCA